MSVSRNVIYGWWDNENEWPYEPASPFLITGVTPDGKVIKFRYKSHWMADERYYALVNLGTYASLTLTDGNENTLDEWTA